MSCHPRPRRRSRGLQANPGCCSQAARCRPEHVPSDRPKSGRAAGFTANNGALTKTLDVKTREDRTGRRAGERLRLLPLGAQLSWPEPRQDQPEEVALNRKGESGDAKANAAVSFATKVVRERGHITEADIKTVGTPASATARSWRSLPSPPRTSSRTCSTWSRRPTSTFRSFAPATA